MNARWQRRLRLATVAGLLFLGACGPAETSGGTAPPENPAAGATAASTVTLSEADTSRPVSVAVGDMIVVRLREQPGTGYRWTLEPISDGALTIDGAPQIEIDPAPVEGGQQTRVFRLRAAAPGTVTLRFHYEQPFGTRERQRSAGFAVTVR